ncbi:MAG TPA: PIG-L family deacetylase [Stellaceae bacterium]|nr:PIG-L family deacetylase [Stellaceae bacterium]
MSAARLLILIPHPDDEVVGCAIAAWRARAAGAEVFGLYLTTGVPARECVWPWRRSRYASLVGLRREEARHAAAALGIVPVGFLDWPSRTLKSHLDEAAAAISRTIAERSIDGLWTPAWEGGHQDHDVANFLAARFADTLPVREFAEYNLAGGRVRSQSFPQPNGAEEILTLTAKETRLKADLISIYRSERLNLRYVRLEQETLRPLARYDYGAPPHPGRLFRERFQWVPLHHPSVDFEPSAAVRAALAAWPGAAAPLR